MHFWTTEVHVKASNFGSDLCIGGFVHFYVMQGLRIWFLEFDAHLAFKFLHSKQVYKTVLSLDY